MTVIFIISIPEYGFLLPLSGMLTPAFSTSTELSVIDVVLSPDTIITLRLASITTMKRMDTIIIPVIVARTYFRKFFILSQL